MNRAIDLGEQVSVLIDPEQCEGLDCAAATVAGARLAEDIDIAALRHAYEDGAAEFEALRAMYSASCAATMPPRSDWTRGARVCSGRERLGE